VRLPPSPPTARSTSAAKTRYTLSDPTARRKWEFVTPDGVSSDPAIASDGTIYFGSLHKKLYALKRDGTKKWEFATGDIVSSPAIAADGTIYFGSWDHKLYAVSPDGTKKWEFATGSTVSASLAIDSDGTIYFGSGDKKVYAINPTAPGSGSSRPAARCNPLPRSPPMARSTSVASTTRSTLSDPGVDKGFPSVPGTSQKIVHTPLQESVGKFVSLVFSAIVSEPRAVATGSCETLNPFVVRLNCVLIRSLPLAVLTLLDTKDHSLA
jgi:hypothetical protein